MTKDKEVTEDIVQGVFAKLWEKRNEYDIQSIKSYLYKACAHQVYNRSKSAHHLKNTAFDPIVHDTSKMEDHEGAIDAQQLQIKIDHAIDSLSPACKEVFVLSRFNQLSYKEIAESLEISVKTVENHMGKALGVMKKQLSSYLKLLIFIIMEFI